ncbi:MAG: HupE/UreJ family protein, partial [Deltaproteobacteria bacterium]|nr:HupE/UreJ family protein [Deltaproteobacteria bacterium]
MLQFSKILKSLPVVKNFQSFSLLLVWSAFYLSINLFTFNASAHTEARSSFSARTDGTTINFDYRLNAISIVEMLKRENVTPHEISKSQINNYKDAVDKYLSENVTVTNNDRACTYGKSNFTGYAKAIDKVVVKIPVICPDELDELKIDCSLFLEEETAHGITSTFYHIRAKEQYVFWGHKLAVINVKKLFQPEERKYNSSGQYRGAGRPDKETLDKMKAVSLRIQEENRKLNEQKAQNSASASTSANDKSETTEQAEKLENALLTYIKQGIVHILGGLDHVLFVLSLVIIILTWKRLALILTSFTVAHSITLALGVFNLVKVSPYIVEPLVALSILFVAVENIFKKDPKSRALVTFGFGLIHGLGFSAVLQNLGLDTGDMIPALFGFNIGVEIGQLLIVAPIFPVIIWINKNRHDSYEKLKLIICSLIAIA